MLNQEAEERLAEHLSDYQVINLDDIAKYGHYVRQDGGFNSDDLIAFYLRCNDMLKFKVTYGTKWKINQISIKNPIAIGVESNSEMAIVSLQNNKNKLSKGYYNISVFYSIDDYSQHTYEAKGKFRID